MYQQDLSVLINTFFSNTVLIQKGRLDGLVKYILTFPVHPTPFQMQKYTKIQAIASVIANGQRIWPGFSSPSVIWCMLRLKSEKKCHPILLVLNKC